MQVNKASDKKTLMGALVLGAILAAPMAAQAAGAAPAYTLTQLGFVPTAINNAGDIVGYQGSLGGSPDAAVVRHANGTLEPLGGLGGLGAWAGAVNASGVAVGQASTSPDGYVPSAVIYQHGQAQNLGATLEGQYLGVSVATGINARGQVVGTMGAQTSYDSDPRRAFIYDKGTLSALGSLGGSSFANGINNKGQATGGSTLGNMPFAAPHAVIFEKGAVKDLGTLGGQASTGQAINEAGQVTGSSGFNNEAYPGASTHAFLYSHGQMKDMGTLGTDLNSYGWAINNAGTVVGWSQRVPSSGYEGDKAFIYQDGQLIDLNTTLADANHATLARALGITDSGQIVGLDIAGRGFLLTPVPEPGTAGLTLLGLAAMGAAVSRARGQGREKNA